ncbi:MAG: sigma-70 family RNA polymerase sigma factor [Pseudomonadota bacterium]
MATDDTDPGSVLDSTLLQTLESERARFIRFLTARFRNPELAEDMLQEARLKLIEMEDEPSVSDPIAYLYRLLENMLRDHLRSEQSRIRRNKDWGDAGEGIAPLRADPTTPERNTLDRDYLEHVLAALDTLPERTKIIFLAYRVEGESQKGIAAKEGISLSAVEKHLQAAYRLIRDVRQKLDAGVGT